VSGERVKNRFLSHSARYVIKNELIRHIITPPRFEYSFTFLHVVTKRTSDFFPLFLVALTPPDLLSRSINYTVQLHVSLIVKHPSSLHFVPLPICRSHNIISGKYVPMVCPARERVVHRPKLVPPRNTLP